MISEETKRHALIYSRCRKFAQEVKANRSWTFNIPDNIIDFVKDEEAEKVQEILKNMGLIQRKDGKWEAK